MNLRLIRAVLLVLTFGVFLSMAFPAPAYEATVVRVIDGDTILLDNGERVRYIGINTPEIHHPTRGKEPYGEAAKEANRRFVEGKTVRLEFDVQRRDKDGHLLAYVDVDGELINSALVREGYAEVATYPPNVRHQNEFLKLQREAREQQRGLWGDAEARRHYKPRGSGVVGRKSFSVYYHPQDPDLAGIPESDRVYFESVAEAQSAGYSASMGYGYYRNQEIKLLMGPPEERPAEEPKEASVESSTPGRDYSSPGQSTKGGGEVKVKGYYRKDGTYIRPHTRSAPKRK